MQIKTTLAKQSLCNTLEIPLFILYSVINLAGKLLADDFFTRILEFVVVLSFM